MALISRPNSYTASTIIDPDEVNADFDTLYTEINGNLTTANLSGSAAITNAQLADIAPSKVLDHADSDTEYMTGTSPGTTAVVSRPTSLEGELERIRYRFLANNHTLFAQYMDSSGVAQSLGWVEPQLTGPNLLPNNGFEVKTSATATNAPDGWTATGTPTGLTIVTTAENAVGTDKRALLVATDAANEGLEVTVSGLKSSTKYLIGMAYVRVSGTVALQTTGNASGAYQNLNLSVAAGTTVAYLQGVVTTDSSGNDLVVKILNTAAGANTFRVYQCWMYEMRDQTTFDLPHIPTQTATDITASTLPTTWTGSGNTWRTDSLTSLSLSQYIPYRGYRLTYEVSVPFADADAADDREGCLVYGAILLQIDSGSTDVVRGPICYRQQNDTANEDLFAAGTITVKYVVDNPTPGSTYNFLFRLGVFDNSNYEQVSVPPVIETVQMEASATLTVERL